MDREGKGALSVADIRQRLSVSDATVRGWIAAGKLRAYQLPGSKKQAIYRIERKDFEWFLRVYQIKPEIRSITDCA